ncbi:MAG: DNA primase [Betaproteobacteria bacterium TMED82]|nr:MAG: DNA primase [Betaproteobacteria bacterium TMED82]|tara:strand:- start:23045 stop:24823 length:1779 start_codon:yes stop_codon:yes gene_type:complete
MITKDFKEQLLEYADIVSIVNSYVPLKKRGTNHVGLCPFHQEKTPSFTVNSVKGFFYCFGCGAKGDVISFLMQYKHHNFNEAIEELAQFLGVPMPAKTSVDSVEIEKRRQKLENLKKLLLKSARFYREQLKQHSKAIQYLKSRGIFGKTASKFHLGFSPNGWQSLKEVFPDYQCSALQEAGLVIVSQPHKNYDRFRGRVMFPILNRVGEVIGFGGRALGTDLPKYLNSPETTVFSKSRELYNFFQAKKEVARVGQVIVVEGYFDVIMMDQCYISNAVATLGTSFTFDHFTLLSKHAKEIIFMFDGDKAGKHAADRALKIVLPGMKDNGTSISFVFLQAGFDPDTYLREFGPEKLKRQIKERIPLSQFIFSTVSNDKDLSIPESASSAIFSLKQLLSLMPASIFKNQVMISAGKRFSCSLTDFDDKLKSSNPKASSKKVEFKPSPIEVPPMSAEVRMVAVVIRSSDKKMSKLTKSELSWFLGGQLDFLLWLQEILEQGDVRGKDLESEFNLVQHSFSNDERNLFNGACELNLAIEDMVEDQKMQELEFAFLYKTIKIRYLEELAAEASLDRNSFDRVKGLRQEILKLKNSQVE